MPRRTTQGATQGMVQKMVYRVAKRNAPELPKMEYY